MDKFRFVWHQYFAISSKRHIEATKVLYGIRKTFILQNSHRIRSQIFCLSKVSLFLFWPVREIGPNFASPNFVFQHPFPVFVCVCPIFVSMEGCQLCSRGPSALIYNITDTLVSPISLLFRASSIETQLMKCLLFPLHGLNYFAACCRIP